MAAMEVALDRRLFISAQVQKFKRTKNPLHLLQALILVLRQQRCLELLYGGYCTLFHRPSPVSSGPDEAALISVLNRKSGALPQGTLSRGQLVELYGDSFKVGLLPNDFQSARWESIWQEGSQLIIGEYGENSRIAYLTPETCVVSDFYGRLPGVRHIHSIQPYGDGGEFLVATGDSRKFLDLWMVTDGAVRFVRRVRKHLAGFTAAIRVNGEYYFGTDFSGRPNFIATLDGTKYFFPNKAYRLYVTLFQAFFDRYIVSVNNELKVAGGKRTVSIFDTATGRFIYCDYLAVDKIRPARRAA